MSFWQNDKKHKLLEKMRLGRKFQQFRKIHVNPKYKMSLASFFLTPYVTFELLFVFDPFDEVKLFGDFEIFFKIFIFYYPVEIFTLAKCKC